LQNGTSSDKLSALILLSSSSPLHTTTYLSQLMGLTKKRSRDEAVRAVRAIVDWLKGGQGGGGSAAGLPDRKLRWFADQPDLHKLIHAREGSLKKDNYQLGDEHLLVWAFEDWLKKWYFELLQAIEVSCINCL
jgi:ribosome biogenesis protein MAK21